MVAKFKIILFLMMLVVFTGNAQTTINVATYGAVGDATNVYVWQVTSNNFVIQTTNVLTSADVGKTIELFGVGNTNIGLNVNNVLVETNQDFIGTIISIDGTGTNIHVVSGAGEPPSNTLSHVYCTYGTQNSPAFQAAVNYASTLTGQQTTIQIPAGNFLLIPSLQYGNFNYNGGLIPQLAGIQITNGGMTFVGAGQGQTTLIACGAFKNQAGNCIRGGVFTCVGPISINRTLPLIWQGVTFDGGVQVGQVGNQGTQPANFIDGQGWDGSDYAGLDCVGGAIGVKFLEYNACGFQHIRGEMIKGITGSAEDETILVTNCNFTDGNATCFNYNYAHTITGCTFSNMYQVEEFYCKYPTNAPSMFANNFVTNVSHGIIALNGGTLTNMPYVISNNNFECNFNGVALATCPAANVTITSNYFFQVAGYSTVAVSIDLDGAQAGQPNACNTNIIITLNNFVLGFSSYFILGQGATSSSSQDRAVNVTIAYNNIQDVSTKPLLTTGWTSGVNIFSNNCNNNFMTLSSGGSGSPFALVAVNNDYYSIIDVNSSGDKPVDYSGGSEWNLQNSFAAGAFFHLVDTDASQIPSGAEMAIYNNGSSTGSSVTGFLDSAETRPVTVAQNATLLAFWTGTIWTTNVNWAINFVAGGQVKFSGQMQMQ